MRAVIRGVGFQLPERVLTNEELARMVDTSDEWIVSRTGIRTRHILEPGQGASALAIPAARQALEDAGAAPADVELIIVATVTPDTLFPSTAIRIKSALGAERAGAYDLSAACSGYVYAMDQAWCALRCGAYRKVLVVGVDVMSSITDYSDRNHCIIFGDGAGALYLEAENGAGEADILYSELGGELDEEAISLPGGGSKLPASEQSVRDGKHYMHMEGRKVFDFAVKKFRELVARAAERSGLQPGELDWVVPHQVNARIIHSALKRIDIPAERVVLNLDRVGNTSGASIPVAFAEAVQAGRVRRGQLVCFVAFGAGLTWGSVLLRY